MKHRITYALEEAAWIHPGGTTGLLELGLGDLIATEFALTRRFRRDIEAAARNAAAVTVVYEDGREDGITPDND